ncbi:DEP domain-containing protein 7-like [Styela clava]
MCSKGFSNHNSLKSPIAPGGQFKATKIWKDLVNHLYENANVKKRRVMMKSHDDCFSGGNAVDTLLSYVQGNADRFPNTTMVTRENIVRLCQSFIDADVFECVNAGDDSEKRSKFEDSSSRLYRFDLKNKREFFKSNMCKSSPSLSDQNCQSFANDVEHLPAKFSNLLTVPRSVEPVARHKTMFSPFGNALHAVGKRSSSEQRRASGSQTSDSDCENRPQKKTPSRLKRSGSFVRVVLKRSSSDSNLRKESSSSTESDSSSKHRSPGDPLTRGRLRLSQRLSFRKKSLRRSGHSSYHLQQPCVIQNPAAGKERLTDQEDTANDAAMSSNLFTHKDLKRRSQRRMHSNSVVADTHCSKVKVVSSKPRQRKLTPQETSHVKRESVRVRLLQILDLPFVESLIISPTFDKKVLGISQAENKQSCGYTGVHYSEVVASYNNDDPWIFNSLTVLQHIPDSYNILRKHARSIDNRKKTELYFAIANHYNALTRPLIDENYNGIAQAIISLLVSRPVDKIMEATQLFVHLLADARLTELRHLCMFLHVVCTQNEVRLVHKGNNQALVIETFTPAILRMPNSIACENGINGCKGLVRFMVQHHLRVFMLPASVEMIVQRKVDLLEQGEIESPSLVTDTAYCTMISESEYQEQRVTYTHSRVRELYSTIQSSTSIAPRKKKDLIKKLQRQHPDVFGVNNNNDADKIGSQSTKEPERKLGHPARSFLTLTRGKQERGLGTSGSHRDLSASGTSKSSTNGNQLRTLPISTRSMRFTAPNSDPLTRKRRNSTRAEVFI